MLGHEIREVTRAPVDDPHVPTRLNYHWHPMRIIAIVGPLKDREFLIGEIEFRIGRQEDNDACLQDDLVSRHHCGIQLRDGQTVVRDFGSKNGTFVNGEAISERALKHGDVLKVGSSIFICKERDVEELLPEFEDDEHDRARDVTTLRAVRSDVLSSHDGSFVFAGGSRPIAH